MIKKNPKSLIGSIPFAPEIIKWIQLMFNNMTL